MKSSGHKGRILFSHGLESGPQSSKIRALRPIAEALGWKSEAIDYRDLLGTLPGDSDADSGFDSDCDSDCDSDSDSPDEPVGDRQLDGQRCIDRLVARLGDIDEPVRLVGSSFGGYVSIMAAERCAVDGLFLMAPALFLEHRFSSTAVRKAYAPKTSNIQIVHGWCDDVVPWSNSVQFAAGSRARLDLVNADHRLSGMFPELQQLLTRFLEQADESGQ